MKKITKLLVAFLLFALVLLSPSISQAATTPLSTSTTKKMGTPTTGIVNPSIGNLGGNQAGGVQEASEGGTFLKYFVLLWQAFINMGALAVIIMFLWGAIEWISAGGDSGKVTKARDRITQAFIGLVLLVGSFVIISYLGKVFFGDNFDILRFTLPTI